jgi:hypothetical protein
MSNGKTRPDHADKYAWHTWMMHDSRIPLAQRAILAYCAIRYARASEGLVIKVRQATIAANMGVDLSTVKRAFATGRRYGWIDQTGKGRRGRGVHEPDSHTLMWPSEQFDNRAEWGTETDPIADDKWVATEPPITADVTDKWGSVEPPITDKWVAAETPITDKWVAEIPEMGGWANAPTSVNGAPTGFTTGLKEITGFKENTGVAVGDSARRRAPESDNDINGFVFRRQDDDSEPTLTPTIVMSATVRQPDLCPVIRMTAERLTPQQYADGPVRAAAQAALAAYGQ